MYEYHVEPTLDSRDTGESTPGSVNIPFKITSLSGLCTTCVYFGEGMIGV